MTRTTTSSRATCSPARTACGSRVEWCADYDAALALIREQRHDVYLIDFRLGARTGLDLVREGFAARPRAPVLILTGQSDYDIDLEASALGVTDYLVKQELNPLSLERSIRYAVSHQQALDDLQPQRGALRARGARRQRRPVGLGSGTGRIYLSPRWHAMLGHPERRDRGGRARHGSRSCTRTT